MCFFTRLSPILSLLALISWSCDVAETLDRRDLAEECAVLGEDTSARASSVLRNDQGQLVVLFYTLQTVYQLGGPFCPRSDSSEVQLLIASSEIWQAVSFSFEGAFHHANHTHSFDGTVAELQPFQHRSVAIFADDSVSFDRGDLFTQRRGPFEYEEPEMPSYKITDGARGHIVFSEHLGPDFETAFEHLRGQERDRYPSAVLDFSVIPLRVEDAQGVVPQTEFSAIRVIDASDGSSFHSLSIAISSNGDHYKLLWPPDD